MLLIEYKPHNADGCWVRTASQDRIRGLLFVSGGLISSDVFDLKCRGNVYNNVLQ